MRKSLHRYLAPQMLLVLHALLLLPILVPYRPDNSIPESPLQVALGSARYSVPFACFAFVSVALFRLIIGSWFSSPSGSHAEWVALFCLGVLEEAVRWGLVRTLVVYEGGGDGYGAKHSDPKGHGYSLVHETVVPTSVEVEPGIWEGVYLMGWSWSVLECLSTWWFLNPSRVAEPSPLLDVDVATISSRPQSFHSWRKEHAKKKSADSTIRTIRTLSRKSDTQFPDVEQNLQDHYSSREEGAPAQQPVMNKYDERASSPELSRRSVREEDNDAGDEETSATDNDNDPLDSPLTPTMYRPVYGAAVPTRSARPTTDDEDDDQEESTPTQQKHNARFLPPGSITSESDYFGRREPVWASAHRTSPPKRMMSEPSRRLSVLASDSETESPTSGAQTPLLSSSIPLDQEQAPLLDQPPVRDYGGVYNTSSTLGNLPPPPPEMQMNRARTSNRPAIASHASYLSITTGDEAEDESDSNARATNMYRAYPSHPAFSSSYIHTHFPTSGAPNSVGSHATAINTSLRFPRPKLATSQSLPVKKGRSRRPRSYPGLSRQGSISAQTMIDSGNRPCINGVDINSVTFVLLVCWTVIAALQHTGYGLWFAWFPTPVFEQNLQWWSIVFFIGISFSKGVYIAQSGTGWIIS
ncbi:hypothetical protein ABW19_dt0203512 [Dactylella cylindrospora]|nr:hypothetical protein ABW19_dt0203512 [Dactylella cylindrospora]